ncbi:MAG: hypothetical protein JWR69_1485 [Pedosphaera sp.]|nr:hypothetical protein [Pedosphaera sp.]
MKTWIVCLCLALLVVAGCTTRARSNAQARAAFQAGRQAALASEPQGPTVQVVGNVKTHIIPWTDGLTLAKALVTAEYQGLGDPTQITVIRNGESANISPSTLLGGKDVPLEAGDRVEIRP